MDTLTMHSFVFSVVDPAPKQSSDSHHDSESSSFMEDESASEEPEQMYARQPRPNKKSQPDDLGLVPAADNHDDDIDDTGEEHLLSRESNGQATMDEDVEMRNMSPSRKSSKSVRWTDDSDGGTLAEVHQALSYNRKELSYLPKQKIKFGMWSPLQKKVMIGCGIFLGIILIVLLTVVLVVVKPSGNNSPTLPPAAPAAPFAHPLFLGPVNLPPAFTSPSPAPSASSPTPSQPSAPEIAPSASPSALAAPQTNGPSAAPV